MTATTHTIYEQPQSPVLENSTPDKPTSQNPMQLNKDGLNTYSIPILSFPFFPPDSSPLSEQNNTLSEKNGKKQKDAYKIYEEIIKGNIEYEHLINAKRLDCIKIVHISV